MPFVWWSYILTIVGLTGFYFVGKKKWWAWWINIGCQVLWLIYAITTQQYGFIAASIAYTIVFTDNLIKWTKEHKKPERSECTHEYEWTLQRSLNFEMLQCRKCGRLQ